MTYVDQVRPLKRPFRRWKFHSHLFADTIEELHQFAARLFKLRRSKSWFQPGPIPHYDLSRMQRNRAVKLGAVPIATKDFIKMWRKAHGSQG